MRWEQYGWTERHQQEFASLELEGSIIPGRVMRVAKGLFTVATPAGKLIARLPGRWNLDKAEPPAVGDWVGLDSSGSLIAAILPRHSAIRRSRPGKGIESQVLAANIDIAFLVSGLDRDFNLRRVERYLVLAGESGARPVIVLNKADVSGNPWGAVEEVAGIAGAAPILLVSALDGTGLGEISAQMSAGETAALLGSSGAGKSTIVNRLLGRDSQRTQATRASDGRGRHTTTRRELHLLPASWLLIDTPGLREVQPWAGAESVEDVFEDIRGYAAECRFRDCRHEGEPGCAVRAAADAGALGEGQLEGYRKLRREAEFLESRTDLEAGLRRKQRDKNLHRLIRKIPNKRTGQR